MSFAQFFHRIFQIKSRTGHRGSRASNRFLPRINALENRVVPANYLAIGAGPGGPPLVAIRVDIHDQIGGDPPNSLGQPAGPRSDGKTDFTSQLFMPFMSGFRGGVHVATGNFDGASISPDELVTAAGPGGGPHVIIWTTTQSVDGKISVVGIRDQFFAFDARFLGGVNVTSGDLDGDGKSELICAAGAGGGPHVKIYKEDAVGHFFLANEFFAYDAGFRGGVSVGSNQGYARIEQVRQVFSEQLPDDFAQVPYTGIPQPRPGTSLGIPLIDSAFFGATGDAPLNPGDIQFFPSSAYFAPNGNPGNLDANNVPLPYVTVASGSIQYLSGNPLNSFGNTVYRPDIFVPPQVANPNDVGEIYFAKWSATGGFLPPGFAPDTTYGPFIRLTPLTTGNGTIDRITRLVEGPGNPTKKSILVTGAGPGGGPHVRVWDFDASGSGLRNNGVVNEFFAFDASFRGGVNVAISDTLTHNDPNLTTVSPGRIDFTQTPPPFIYDTTSNSGFQQAMPFGYPIPTEMYRRDTPEITVSMASGGNTVRIFADRNPTTTDPVSPASANAPSHRTSVTQVNYVPSEIDATVVVDPNNPLGGFTSVGIQTDFNRGLIPSFLGGMSSTASVFRFAGTANSFTYGTNVLTGTGGITTNPVLGQATFASGSSAGSINNSLGGRVRIFDQMSVIDPSLSAYQPVDDFDAFNSNGQIVGASIAAGFGPLANQDGTNLDIVMMPNQIPIRTVTDPILVNF